MTQHGASAQSLDAPYKNMTSFFHIPPALAASFFDWLLGLTRLSAGDGRAELGWRFAMPAWVWIIIILAVVLISGWSYGKLQGPRAARLTLASLRAAIILFIIALLAGPMLVVEDYRLEPDVLLVLVDRSRSMEIADVLPDGAGKPMSRDRMLREALAKDPSLFGPEKLGKDRRIIWLGFDGNTREIDAPTADPQNMLAPPQGQATNLRTAIDQSLERAIGRPISGIVLFTDGRSPQATGGDLVTRLRQQRIGVYPVPLGSRETPLNFAITRIDAPDRAYVNDTIPITLQLERTPADAPFDPARLSLRLIDPVTGRVLDERRGDDITFDQPMRLTTESAVTGKQTWTAVVEYETTADMPITQRELLTDDNPRDVEIELIDRPIRVLYVEGYPRWEYRYLKTLLMREKSIDSSLMLLSADRAFAQEGTSPITRLPMSMKEMEPYDVIIIGDVPASHFSSEQLEALRDHVDKTKAGIIWIGGEYAMPRSYDNTVLENLLPMREPGAVARIDPSLGAVSMAPQPMAAQLGVLRLREDLRAEGRTRDLIAWPRELPGFLWAQNVGPLKPTAETLALSNDLEGVQVPLVSRLRYGGGQSIYLASDETWRWRFGRGEHYFQQYWIQLIRMIARERLQRRDERVYLELSHRTVQLEQTVQLTLHVRDVLLLQRNLPRISVGVTRRDDPAERILERIELTATAGDQPANAEEAAREYTAQWRTNLEGDLALRVIQPGLDDLNIAEPITVLHPDDERRQPATDHPRLETLASETGGKVIAAANLDELIALVPKRAQRTPNDDREALWDSPLAMIFVLLLITVEWVGRKRIRLV